jgi:cytochrome c oxidase subunit 2
MDWLHGFSLQPENINIEVHPGYELVVTMTLNAGGHVLDHLQRVLRINHHTMASRLYVVQGE